MSAALLFLAPAFALCLVLAGIHVYLGMHILARGVIFVDLALAQLAGLGAVVGTLLGDEDGLAQPLFALGFTLLGAAVFALARHAERHALQEAIVGIVYAVTAAATVLALAQSPHGAEAMKEILVGSLLLTSWSKVATTALLYAGIGALQLLWRRPFLALSWHRQTGAPLPRGATAWDFLFYALLGVVVTSAVQAAGVLVVFSFLIVPAVITQLFSARLGARLLAGWGVACGASVLGLAASWRYDLPTGAAVVVAFGVLLLGAGGMRWALPRAASRPLPSTPQTPLDTPLPDA